MRVLPSSFVCLIVSCLFIEVNLIFASLMKLNLINSPLFINLPRLTYRLTVEPLSFDVKQTQTAKKRFSFEFQCSCHKVVHVLLYFFFKKGPLNFIYTCNKWPMVTFTNSGSRWRKNIWNVQCCACLPGLSLLLFFSSQEGIKQEGESVNLVHSSS